MTTAEVSDVRDTDHPTKLYFETEYTSDDGLGDAIVKARAVMKTRADELGATVKESKAIHRTKHGDRKIYGEEWTLIYG